MLTPSSQAPDARACARSGIPALPREPLPDLPAEVVVGDWDYLLSAVKSRVRLSAEACFAAAAPQALATDEAGKARASVLECLAALDQLHEALRHELGGRPRRAPDGANARATSQQPRAEPTGTEPEGRFGKHFSYLQDSLTLLPNHLYFLERLHAALGQAQAGSPTLAVLHLDLDDFVAINDEFGRETGDKVLRIVAARLLRAVRADDMVSRIGNDDFALLIEKAASREDVNHLACKVFDLIAAPMTVGNRQLTVLPSIGISMSPGDGNTAEALLKNAETAMCSARQQRSGYAFFDERAEDWAPWSLY
jgi:diguanylate cyclase (GGDEF)-like protein